MNDFRRTTNWAETNGMKCQNFYISYGLYNELLSMKNITGSTISEMIRTGIRMYIKEKKRQLADEELRDLNEYRVRQQNQGRRITTGLLPDY
jgi:hypothetical protein